MKKLTIALLLIALLVPLAATAAQLNMQVMDMLYVNAEVPENTPAALPILTVAPYQFDADHLQQLLMANDPPREDDTEPGQRSVMFGTRDELSEYLLVSLDSGSARYRSAFWSMYLGSVVRTRDEMSDSLHYYPEDREVSGLPRADALKQARALIDAMGLSQSVAAEPRIVTIDEASYATMQAELSISDEQTYLPRRYLEPYDGAHDGYFLQFPHRVEGVPELDVNAAVELFISHQGIEYLETGLPKVIVERGAPQKLLTAEAALKAALPEMIEKEAAYYVVGSFGEDMETLSASTVERIRLGYRYDFQTKVMTPIWEFTFLRVIWPLHPTWRTRTFDNPACLGLIQINAITGEYIETLQQ